MLAAGANGELKRKDASSDESQGQHTKRRFKRKLRYIGQDKEKEN